MTTPKQPVILCILDGFGASDSTQHNAIHAAHTPNLDALLAECPSATLATSGDAVGLPTGQMGNSEVGHMTIGAGRIIKQLLPRIDSTIATNKLGTLPAITQHINALQASGGTCHIMGLLSDGGVHAHINHIIALADTVSQAGVPVRIHAFLDGRDTAQKSAHTYLNQLNEAITPLSNVQLATVGGRYFGMDRDNRWDRVQQAYSVIAHADGTRATTAAEVVDDAYEAGKTDEFVPPTVLGDYAGMADDDGIIMANFRADRAREMLAPFALPEFDGFNVAGRPTLADIAGMVNYADFLEPYVSVIFPVENPQATLGEVVATANLNQLRIAETEKYAHVTFFLSGGREAKFNGEERVLIPSPDVATYDLQPEMSAPEVTDKLVAAIESGDFSLMSVNFANGDMVGHTGDMAAATQAIETLDESLGRLRATAETAGTALLILADHGNAEEMVVADTGEPHTQHTTNPVPFILANGPTGTALQSGGLADVAPTVLALLGLPQPTEMTGKSLLQ